MQMPEFTDILFIYSVDRDSMRRIIITHSDHRHQYINVILCFIFQYSFPVLLFTHSSFHINQDLDLDFMLALVECIDVYVMNE